MEKKEKILQGFILTILSGVICGTVLMITERWIKAPDKNSENAPPARVSEMDTRDGRYSLIQRADGFANVSEETPLADARILAFSNAERNALDAGKSIVEKMIRSRKGTGGFRVVWPNSGKNIRILEKEDLGQSGDGRYCVRITAEVDYFLEKKSEYPVDSNAPLTVNLWAAKKEYRLGEKIEIRIQGNRDYYARVVNISPTGDVIQLLPNAYRDIRFFEAGKVYKIPDTGDRFDLEVCPPFGTERIVLYASDSPLGSADMEVADNGLLLFRKNAESLGVLSRGVKVVPKANGEDSQAQFYETECSFLTKEK